MEAIDLFICEASRDRSYQDLIQLLATDDLLRLWYCRDDVDDPIEIDGYVLEPDIVLHELWARGYDAVERY